MQIGAPRPLLKREGEGGFQGNRPPGPSRRGAPLASAHAHSHQLILPHLDFWAQFVFPNQEVVVIEPSFPGCFGRTVKFRLLPQPLISPPPLVLFHWVYQAMTHLVPCANVWFGHHRSASCCVCPPPAPKALTHTPLNLWHGLCSHLDEAPGPTLLFATEFALLHMWVGSWILPGIPCTPTTKPGILNWWVLLSQIG